MATKLNRGELEGFFLYKYEPTALVSPWTRGSGFFLENDQGLKPLESSISSRFQNFRSAIQVSRPQLKKLQRADGKVREIKEETKRTRLSSTEKDKIRNSKDYKERLAEAERRFKQLKEELIPSLRRNWRGGHRQWMDAAMVLSDDGTPKYPALLGSGGNDGRLDYANNFMKQIGKVFVLNDVEGKPRPESYAWISGSLWGEPTHDVPLPVGQYLPGTVGGANNANGPDSESAVNPMDYILMLEGVIAFTSQASKRFGALESSRAASPFVVDAFGSAYPSASANDKGPRGEQWMPLWSQPSSYVELHRMFSEGRAQLGSKTAREPLALARAVKRNGRCARHQDISTIRLY